MCIDPLFSAKSDFDNDELAPLKPFPLDIWADHPLKSVLKREWSAAHVISDKRCQICSNFYKELREAKEDDMLDISKIVTFLNKIFRRDLIEEGWSIIARFSSSTERLVIGKRYFRRTRDLSSLELNKYYTSVDMFMRQPILQGRQLEVDRSMAPFSSKRFLQRLKLDGTLTGGTPTGGTLTGGTPTGGTLTTGEDRTTSGDIDLLFTDACVIANRGGIHHCNCFLREYELAGIIIKPNEK
jgi:hypothetical protein